MNEEEKKAIEILNTFEFRGKTRNYKEISSEDSKSVKIVLNLIKKLQKENEKLKNIRYDTPYGTETIHLIPESDLIEINTQKYMIEVEPGKFVDLKQVYLENKELKNLIAHKNAYTKMLEKDLFENCSNYVISKQKVKDKIEEYKNILETCNKSKDVDRIKAINERVLELEELLEKNEEESKCPKKQENKNIEK